MFECCNRCKYLSIDEHTQNRIFKETGVLKPHVCLKYNVRVLHMPYREPFIHRCKECIQNGGYTS